MHVVGGEVWSELWEVKTTELNINLQLNGWSVTL